MSSIVLLFIVAEVNTTLFTPLNKCCSQYLVGHNGCAPIMFSLSLITKSSLMNISILWQLRVTFRVVCSTGTYIRSMARDLGEKLETGGHLYSLRRTRAGAFDVRQSIGPNLASWDDIIPPEKLMADLARIDVGPEFESRIGHGRAIPTDRERSPLRIFNKKGQLIAIAAVERGWAHPRVVLI